MVFSSHLFVFYFLPAALALYYLLPRRGRHLGLTALSYLFYGWANPAFTVLMATSTVIDYLCGLVIGGAAAAQQPPQPLPAGGGRNRRQRVALVVSVVSNLSLLGFFKYFNFAVDSYNELAALLGLGAWQLDTVLRVALPLGISFYTFQSMSYTIDLYYGRAAALRSFVDFACYVSLFPQLVAGPIIRFREIAEQLEQRTHTLAKFARGVAILCLGMTKKVLLADPCGRIADAAFGAAAQQQLDAWWGVIAYSFQIYFDFSGYSDMAIGLGLMLGFVFPKNFASPYRAASLSEFWQRWHISLSTWLRDYLYIPLGGNRRGPRRTDVNLMLVMLLGGLWHGAGWNFVVWGGIHGGWLALERALGRQAIYSGLPRLIRVALTYLVVLVSWVFFRAPDLSSALNYLGSMAGLGGGARAALLSGILYRPFDLLVVGLAALVVWGGVETADWTQRLTRWKAAAALGLFVLALVMLETQGYSPFIYFIF
ncbi:MAG TPA: MBOAT family O-acyltransferase [Thermoanaerobaculia bacterium]|nr:MBOAT family O-acyltransferase [Thermoanaerobaculia bacterium]